MTDMQNRSSDGFDNGLDDGLPHDPFQDDMNATGATSSASDDSWSSGEVPVDDFGDPSLEDAARVVDEEPGASPASMSMDEGEEKKKRSALLPVVVALGVIVLLGGVLYWQFGSSSRGGEEAIAKGRSVPAAVKEDDDSLVASKTALSPVVPAAVSADDLSAGAGKDSAEDAAVVENGVAMPVAAATPSSEASSVSGASASSLDSPKNVAEVVSPPVSARAVADRRLVDARSSVDSASTAALERRLDALTAQVEVLSQSLERTAQQLHQTNAKLEALQSVSPSVKAGAARRSSAVTSRASAGSSIELDANSSNSSIGGLAGGAMERVASAKKKTASSSKTKRSASASKTKARSASAPSKQKSSVASKVGAAVDRSSAAAVEPWVLRAATPDEGWISRGFTMREMHPVHVGDVVEGIGRVVAIQQVGTVWVVEGTQGVIH